MTAGETPCASLRQLALLAARAYLGTPYRHQGSRRGIGCDCLGLIRGVWRALYGDEPEDPGAYTTDWSARGGPDRLLDAALRHLTPIAVGDAEPGDVVLFAWRAGGPATHCGILDAPAHEPAGHAVPAKARRMIHAYEGSAVVSSPLPLAWQRRIVGAFRFPE